MRKITLTLMALLSMTYIVNAQQYVSTEPSNRNVILEEFTGRTCQWCPAGHVIANNIASSNPGRFWSVNIHSDGYFSATTYPNLNTVKGNSIRAAFSATSFPSGVVNRSTSSAVGRDVWTNYSNSQFNQAAECNVAGLAQINPGTRLATITVEVYYTGNSSESENYLTVMMLQDSIFGSQTNGSANPAQWINGQYCHMHVLRDVITANMGDAISPTTQGSLITKTYEYQIPDMIGSPNGVEVVLDHINFIAFVTEKYQNTPTRPVLNACALEKTTMSSDPIHPVVMDVEQVVNASCSNVKTIGFNLVNIGTEDLNTVRFNAQVADATNDFEWNGKLEPGERTMVTFDMEIPFGTFTGELNIVEANGEVFEAAADFVAESTEWAETEVSEELTSFKVYIIQDMYGEQITWDVINSAGVTVASGGPYTHLAGAGTQAQVANVTGVSSDECYLFRIFDSGKNGICCDYGEGYYYIKDANGNKIIEGDGDFGAMATELFNIRQVAGIGDNAAEMFSIYPNPAENKIFVEGENIGMVELYNSLGQMVLAVEGASEKTAVDVSSCDNGVYFVRVFTNDGAVTTKKVSVVR